MEAIHKAMNYIREHMDREITLEELLRLTGMSKSHFSKNFKKVTGKTFVTYLNDMRIESAKNTWWRQNNPFIGLQVRLVIWMNIISEGFSGKERAKTQNSTVKITKK